MFSLLLVVLLVHGCSTGSQSCVLSLVGSNFGNGRVKFSLGLEQVVRVFCCSCKDGNESVAVAGDDRSVVVVFSIIVYFLKVWKLFVVPGKLFCSCLIIC